MNAPQLPADFYPDEPLEERIDRWFTLEDEARQMRERDLMKYEEPLPPRPFWMRDCTHEGTLRMRGYM